MTTTDRTRRYEERRKAKGHVRVIVWTRDETDAQRIRNMAATMMEKEI